MLDTKTNPKPKPRPKVKLKKEELLAQNNALKVYLDSLLHDVPDYVEELVQEEETPAFQLDFKVNPDEVFREAEKMLALVMPRPVLAPPVLAPVVLAPPVEIPWAEESIAEIAVVEPVEQSKLEPIVEVQASVPVTPSVVPDYAKEKFRIINFTVGGLKLAVPLAELGGVCMLDEDVKPVAGKPEWVRGLTRFQGSFAHVVDTYQLIFPPNKVQQRPARNKDKQYLVFDDSHKWALICDEVSDVTEISAEEIKWRTDKSTRTWMAGTVINQLCVLIDLKKIGQLLEKGHELV